MSESKEQDSDRLTAAMMSAFPDYLWRRLRELGVVAGSAVERAVAAATIRLEQGLSELLARRLSEQAKSPLELCREATAEVTAALTASGLTPPERDEWETDRHPDDVYGLYPASSQDLGEEAWRLHLDWGVAKAQRVAGVVPADEADSRTPTVALFGVPADDREALVAGIEGRGYSCPIWRNPAALAEGVSSGPILVFVDIRHPQAHAAIRIIAGEGIRTVVTGDYVDDLMTPGLMALGAEAVVNVDRVLSSLDGLLPRII